MRISKLFQTHCPIPLCCSGVGNAASPYTAQQMQSQEFEHSSKPLLWMHQLSWLPSSLHLIVSHTAPTQRREKDKHLRQSGKAGYSSPFCMTAMDLSSRVSQLSLGSTVRFIAPCLASPPSSPRLLAVGGH